MAKYQSTAAGNINHTNTYFPLEFNDSDYFNNNL